MILAGLSFLQVAAIFGAVAVFATALYILKLRRRTVAVPFSKLWEKILRDKEATSLFSRLKRLLSLLLVVPATGLLLVVVGTDWLFVHVTAQLLLVGVIALHVGLVLKHTVLHRHSHLTRML